jgi:sec-independent protein translocase protein TatC
MISQTLLAIPMWVLFEAGLIASRYFLRMKQERAEAEEGEDLDTEEDMEAALDRYESEEPGRGKAEAGREEK